MTLGCLGLIVIAIVANITGHQGGSTQSSVDKAQHERDVQDYALQSVTEATLKAAMRDPASVEFKDVFVIHKDSSVTVCGSVNAKNGFGGFTGFTHFIAYGTRVMVKSSENEDVFVPRWNKRCVKH